MGTSDMIRNIRGRINHKANSHLVSLLRLLNREQVLVDRLFAPIYLYVQIEALLQLLRQLLCLLLPRHPLP